jgi:hypothetical protein
LGANTKSLQQAGGPASDAALTRPARGPYVDFTVVSGYFERLLLVAVLIVLGVAEGVLESL